MKKFLFTKMKYTSVLLVLCVHVILTERVFKSVPVTVKTYENDTVLLPCYIDDMDAKHRVRWYKNEDLLGDSADPHHLLPARIRMHANFSLQVAALQASDTADYTCEAKIHKRDESQLKPPGRYKNEDLLGDSADPHHLLPPRIRMHANYSLQVTALQASDTADYTCEVVRPEPWGPIRQTHSIEVQYSPTIRTIPEDGFVEVTKGDFVDIGCEAAGVPPPIVDWRKNGEPMALLEHRSRIKFKAEHRLLAGVYECVADNGVGDPVKAAIRVVVHEHRSRVKFKAEHRLLAGVYECVADNGVGDPVKAAIRVVVHDAPVVSAERSFVHTAIGLRAVLAARLEFEVPPARTAWYRDGRPVRVDDRVVIMVQDNVHQLIFRSVRKGDFGNYTFRAENKLGMADVSFKLTGVPNAASFKVESSLNKATATSFNLIWEVDSYSNIIEYNLWIRPYYGHPTADPDSYTTELPANYYSKIVVPGDSSEGPIHSASYTVKGLTPSTVYEAIVTSRNRFGWSKPSAVLHFATEPGTGRQPYTTEYSDIVPLLEDEPEKAHNITQAHVFVRQPASAGKRETPCLAAILICSWIFVYS